MKKIRNYIGIIAISLLFSGCRETMADAIEKDPTLRGEKIVSTEMSIEGTEIGTEAVVSTEAASEATSEIATEIADENVGYDFTICMTGDINLEDDGAVLRKYKRADGDLSKCISQELLDEMQNADILCVNNEFAYSTRGKKLAGKAFTFRSNSQNVEILQKLGVDIANLANNHVYDYGKQAMLDTFDTLEQAGIPYVGAGKNLKEAMQPVYVDVQDKKVAFVSASRAEKNKLTPQAKKNVPGILRCYDNSLFLKEIKEAKDNADFVVVYVHWGTEYSTKLEKEQKESAREYIDAGADVVVGAHPHILQGMEYYQGKPIIYSLGNFWFGPKTMDTMLLKLEFSGDDTTNDLSVKIIPAKHSKATVQYVSDENEQEKLYEYLRDISVNVAISTDGQVYAQQ